MLRKYINYNLSCVFWCHFTRQCPHQPLGATRQHHTRQGDADWELAGVDSAQRDTYWKAFNAVVTLDRRAPLLAALPNKRRRAGVWLQVGWRCRSAGEGNERRTLSNPLGAFWASDPFGDGQFCLDPSVELTPASLKQNRGKNAQAILLLNAMRVLSYNVRLLA